MPTLKELVDERVLRVENIPTDLFDGIAKAEQQAYKEILKLINQLDTVDGVIQLTSKNYALTQQIGELTQTVFFNGEYIKSVEAFASEFPVQAGINRAYFNKAFGGFTESELYAQTLRISQANAINLLNTEAVDQVLINPLKESLNNSISSGATLSDTIVNVQRIVIGDATKESNMLGNHRKTLVRDAYAISDREYANVVSGQYDFTFYKYQGGNVADTRCFCQSRAGGTYPRRQIEAWGDRKDLGSCRSGNGWQGMAYGTNSKTIFQLVGGFNCQHILVSIPDEAVSDATKRKAIKKGYIK